MEFKRIIGNYKEDIIKTTQQLVRIKSTEGKPKVGMPFGEGPYEALEFMLEKAERMGFSTKNVDGYAGHAEIGEGKKIVGVLVHLDVVPEGSGWTYPPYEAQIYNGKIFGRGTNDDKGPAVASLFAAKAIKESNLNINKKIRIIFGTNEETRWEGIEYYLQKEDSPDIAFTPDSDFPVIHGEKGILEISLQKKFSKSRDSEVMIKEIRGGNRSNMVPDLCTTVLKVSKNRKASLLEKINKIALKKGYNISIREQEDIITLKIKGKSAHASTPQLGQNAISITFNFLNELNIDNGEIGRFIKFYNNKIGLEYNGESIGCQLEDEVSGKLTFNVGVAELDERNAKLSINIRYPIKYSKDDVEKRIKDNIKDIGIQYKVHNHLKSINYPKDHMLIKKLMKVYREVTGDDSSNPITIGGGTYARAIENAVAFGPSFPGSEKIAHQKDEYISIDNLMKCTEIYCKALYELAK